MDAVSPAQIEAQDAEKVDQALAVLVTGKVAEAEALLLEVIANTPSDYVNSFENPDGDTSIKFWDVQDFMRYVVWQQDHGEERNLRWIKNAYPRAYYYLGFVCVKTRQYRRAIEYLDRGQALEPTNPRFNCEKAQALIPLGEKEAALALYQAVDELGPHVGPLELALAYRGRGFVLIELNRLDEAEAAFKKALELEPGNQLALGELECIAHLRKGRRITPGEVVETRSPNLTACAVCGSQLTRGKVSNVGGLPRFVCERCQQKASKKWWQFWK